MSVKILRGDCREILKELPEQSIQCCVSSPPYWGLRSYGIGAENGELGLETTPEEYVATMVEVFDGVRRVLKPDGVLWLNLGDSYARSQESNVPQTKNKPVAYPSHDKTGSSDGAVGRGGRPGTRASSLAPKQLVGIPWRVAFALQAGGWWLRQDVIWSKPNPMPESVTDRCTKAHEYIFMLTKSARYFYDAAAIAEDAIYSGLANQDESGFKDPRSFNGKHKDGDRTSDKQRGHSRRHAGFNDRWDAMELAEQCSGKRNKRSVWEIATSPFPDAHFATFPPALVEPCIRAGSKEGDTILDPFGGAGTVGLVADRWKRNAILIELNPAYAAMAERRIHDDAPLFAETAA